MVLLRGGIDRPYERGKNMFKKFKEFAFKGNVLDMAIGVVVGTAFSKIVSSFVADVIMPLISILTGGIDFTTFGVKLGEGEEAAVLAYGNFMQAVVDFFIIAFSMFLVMSIIGAVKDRFAKKQEAAAEEAAPAGPTEAELLAEIRDLLKEKN